VSIALALNNNDMRMKPIKEIEVKTAKELLDYLSDTNNLWENKRRHNWVFRGIPDLNYKLIPSALRNDAELGYSFKPIKCPQPTNVLQIEAELKKLQEFYWEADSHGLKIPGNPNLLRTPKNWEKIKDSIKKVGWPIDDFLPLLALAQHYGIPTRLLDWTENPMVAVYFAVKDILKARKNRGNGKFVIWALDLDWVINQAFPGGQAKKMSIYVVTAPRSSNQNLHAQEGVFTTEQIIPSELNGEINIKSVDEIVRDYFKKEDCKNTVMIKFLIPKSIASELLRLLNQKNINAATIYPGYKGVADALIERKFWDKKEPVTYWFRSNVKLDI